MEREGLERRRRWIKVYPLECLDGSIRYQLEADERGVWYDLLNFSVVCVDSGSICDRDHRPYPHSFIANRLNITVELLERTLKKCLDEGRLVEDERGIRITNWKYYQSEYDRVKGYQQAYRERKRSEREKVGMTRVMVNKKPAVAIDVLTNDFGHTVVSKDGEILGRKANDRYRPRRKEADDRGGAQA